jgi:hypothetical protein
MTTVSLPINETKSDAKAPNVVKFDRTNSNMSIGSVASDSSTSKRTKHRSNMTAKAKVLFESFIMKAYSATSSTSSVSSSKRGSKPPKHESKTSTRIKTDENELPADHKLLNKAEAKNDHNMSNNTFDTSDGRETLVYPPSSDASVASEPVLNSKQEDDLVESIHSYSLPLTPMPKSGLHFFPTTNSPESNVGSNSRPASGNFTAIVQPSSRPSSGNYSGIIGLISGSKLTSIPSVGSVTSERNIGVICLMINENSS